jgi:hypothetical protein
MSDDAESFEPGDHDRDRANVVLRAGYLMGMAAKLPPGDDRMFLMRACRSLRAYAEHLRAQKS